MPQDMVEIGDRIRAIRKRDPRYTPEAYEFIFQALGYTLSKVGERRHVSARELLDGIREFALQRFGNLTLLVLERWGVRETHDFGEIVFNLIDDKLMSRTETDTKEDFRAVYDFHDAFGANEPLEVEWSDEG
jgi:uncharacterized repeat protein (TIGR04138 family)